MVSIVDLSQHKESQLNRRTAVLNLRDEYIEEEESGTSLRGDIRQKFIAKLNNLSELGIERATPRLQQDSSRYLTPECVVKSILLGVHSYLCDKHGNLSANGHPTPEMLHDIGRTLLRSFPDKGYERFIGDCLDLLERVKRGHLEWPDEDPNTLAANHFALASQRIRGGVDILSQTLKTRDAAPEDADGTLAASREESIHPERYDCHALFRQWRVLSLWANKASGIGARSDCLREEVDRLAREIIEVELVGLMREFKLVMPDSFPAQDILMRKLACVIQVLHAGGDGTYSLDSLQDNVKIACGNAHSRNLLYLERKLRDLSATLTFAHRYIGSQKLRSEVI